MVFELMFLFHFLKSTAIWTNWRRDQKLRQGQFVDIAMSERGFQQLKKRVEKVDRALDKNSPAPSVRPARRKLGQFKRFWLWLRDWAGLAASRGSCMAPSLDVPSEVQNFRRATHEHQAKSLVAPVAPFRSCCEQQPCPCNWSFEEIGLQVPMKTKHHSPQGHNPEKRNQNDESQSADSPGEGDPQIVR
jgi:hypothetical protein